MTLTKDDLIRYDRQVRIYGFGRKGQEKLKKSNILVVGAGGLGCAASMYLTVAGIGHISIIDQDKVELSNLNRQVLHWQKDIGKYKAASASVKLRQMNPTIKIDTYPSKATYSTLKKIVKKYDVVLDCLDNWQSRFALNKACVEARIPFIHAGIRGMGGQVTAIKPRYGPCLQCIFPKTPKAEKWPVLGAAPGMLGCIQAIEAIKLITGIGKSLVGRILVYDGEASTFYIVKTKREKSCPICGKSR